MFGKGKDTKLTLRISRQAALEKDFTTPEEHLRETLTPEEAEAKIPTAEEREWFKLVKSTAPELETARLKASICLEVEVDEITDNKIVYTYEGNKIVINAPVNSFKICRALDSSRVDAFAELCNQGCVIVDGKPIKAERNTLSVSSLNLMIGVAYRFFFQSYL